MKKVCLIITCIVLSISVFVCASAEEDISKMKSEELLRLEEQIQVELAKRGENGLKLLPAGTYVVGKDIAEGKYLVHYIPGGLSALEIEIYKAGTSSDGFVKDNYEYPRIFINDTQGDASLSLTEGLIVVVHYIGDGYGTIEKTKGLFMD